MLHTSSDRRFIELLQAWQDGALTHAGERELFELAAQDPFLQAALDGFIAFPEQDHAAAIARLRERLGLPSRSRRFPIPAMAAAAAAILLVAGAIWMFDQAPQPAETIAKTEQPATEQAPSGISDAEAPSIRSATQAPQTPAELPRRSPDASSADAARDLADTDAPVRYDDQGAGITVERSTNVAPEVELAKAAEQTEMLQQQTSVFPAPSKTTEDQADKAVKKAKRSTAPAGAPTVDPGGAPQDGWDAFNTYVRSRARLTPAALNNNVTGTVRLQFRINPQNQPTGFLVLRSLGYGCDEAAIQLVKDWNWQRLSDAPVILDVPFVR